MTDQSTAKAWDHLTFKTGLVWDSLSEDEKNQTQTLAEEYKNFLNQAKTERLVVSTVAGMLAQNGYGDLASPAGTMGTEGGFWAHHGKMLGIFKPGQSAPEHGFNVIVAHGDSPRLDLKPKCVYEESGFGMLKTNLYGGLKKFHWVARPLALWGHCVLRDGRTVELRLGEEPGDPVLTVADLLPHLDRKVQRDKKISEAFPAEKLNLLAASLPLGAEEDKNRLKLAILKILNDRWGLNEEDLISSEIEVVPAGLARDVGLDGSMVGGYGQDDRLAVFAAVKAMLDMPKQDKPLLAIIYDREEIGSYGSTGASGNFIENLAARAFEAMGQAPDWFKVRRALMASSALSADVEGALDPDYKEVHEDLNAARLGHGPCLVRYTGGAGKYGASEAGAEFMAKLRQVFAEGDVKWQSTLLGRQEEGGGGTVALYLAEYGMNIADCGSPLLAMHSPFEICSKADLFMTTRAYKSFFLSK